MAETIEMGIVGVLLAIVFWLIIQTMKDALKKSPQSPRWEQEVQEIVERRWDEDDMDRIQRNAW